MRTMGTCGAGIAAGVALMLQACGGGGGGDDGNSAGLLSFVGGPDYVVGEDGVATAAVAVGRFGGANGVVSVVVTPTAGSATAGAPPLAAPADFDATPIVVVFADGDSATKIVSVPILDDGIVEADETATLTLGAPSGGASLGAFTVATLTITNDDFPGTIAFGASPPIYGEDGSVTTPIVVRRIGGVAGAVSAVLTASDGTASGDPSSDLEPVDYAAFSTTVAFADGDGADVFVPFVGLTQDLLPELDETIVLGLATPTGGAAVSGATTLLTILDDDTQLSLVSSTPGPGRRFGSAGAVAGGRLAVGEPEAPGGGVVRVFDPALGTLINTIAPNPPLAASSSFGAALAGSGGDLAVGQPGTSSPTARVVDVRTSALRFLSNGVSSDFANVSQPRFGSLVRLKDDVLYVTSPFAAHPSLSSFGSGPGRVHAFNITTGTLAASLPPTASFGLPSGFGAALAADDARLFVGSNGGNFDGTAWVYGDPGFVLGAFIPNPFPVNMDGFGSSIAVLGDVLFVGTPGKDVGGADAGAVYRFDRVSGDYLGELAAPVPAAGARFGAAMFVLRDRLIVQQSAGGPSGAGRLFVFDAAGTHLQTIDAPNPVASANFGGALADVDGQLFVGAPGATVGADAQAGRAYVIKVP